jgi:AmmeMemoRadiSam system protein A
LVDAGRLPDSARAELLCVARASIESGLRDERFLPDLAGSSPLLCEPGASFVTLYAEKRLRGCIGTLEARDPLIVDVAGNAWNAASRDTRFPPVTGSELDQLEIHISVLSRPEPVSVGSEPELLAVMRPGIDGLIIEDHLRRGTFLPSVWEQLPDPRDFLRQLKRKVGLPDQYWSDSLKVSRYTTESFS